MTQKTPKRTPATKKVAKTSGKGPQTDLFVLLCRAELKLELQKEFKFHPVRMWRFDYASPEHKVALEVEGGVWTQGRHTRPQGFLEDIEKYNQAALAGWTVLRTTPSDLLKGKTLDMIKQATQPIKQF